MADVLPYSAERLSLWLIHRALCGLPSLSSASELADRYLRDARHPHNEARIDALVRWETAKNFTAGFVTSMAGILALPVALPANLGAVFLLQARLAAAVARLRGHDLEDPWVHTQVLLSLTGAAAPEIMRQAGVRAGQWVAGRAVARLSETTLVAINRRVGFRLLTSASGKGAISMSRMVPVAGAAVGGLIDAYSARSVAKTARQLFLPPLALPPRR